MPDRQITMWAPILLGLLSGGLVLTSEIQNECAKGAAYWCSNLMTAIKCGALDRCVQTWWNQASNESVWNRSSNEDMCADCKQLISLLVRMAKESAFKKSLQEYLEAECTNLPLQTLIPQCQALVKDYYARLIASLEKQLDPGVICSQLGACPADLPGSQDAWMWLLRGLLPQLPGQRPILPGGGHTQESPGEATLPIPLPLCWLCRTFVGKAEAVIPKAAIGKAMSKLCYIMPGVVAGMCQCLMEKYTVIIVDTIVSKLGPRLVCGMMLMCTSQEENCGPESLLPATAEGCRVCLALSGQVAASQVGPDRSRRAVEAALSGACSPSSPSWPQCHHFISQHQPKLSALLMEPWDPQTTCQELGACRAEQLWPSSTPCAQGPTYWCSSWRAAEQCKATRHCQDHVWL
ncbi:pulmonary surfactant-associated protein B isoform X3 [Erythrolamprus reginae]|uniref:pulmonary surfactant-associated protein B isoform X3 n=2 Tax=Erythrolamprus reginae TaxID=121349 RepID=UPI00396C4EB9